MYIKKLLLKGGGSLLLGGALLFCFQPAEAAVTGSFEAAWYQGRLDRYPTIRVYKVAGAEDVPYVSIQEYLSGLYNGDIEFDRKGSRLIATRNNSSVEFDLDSNRIASSDIDAFFGSYGAGALHNGLLQPGEFNAIAVSGKHPSNETEAMPLSIELASFQSMEQCGQQVLLPFAVLQGIFAVPRGDGVMAFNGSDFYNLSRTKDFIYRDSVVPKIRTNPYADAYYSGEFSKRKEISPAYARYAYDSTCLLLDLYYGHKKEKGIEDFDSYLEQQGLKEKLLSTDPREASQAFRELVDTLFDSGHDHVYIYNSVFDDGKHIRTGKIINTYGGLEPMVDALKKLTYRVADKGVNFQAGDVGTYGQYEAACRELQLNPVLLTYIFREDGSFHEQWQDESRTLIRARKQKDERAVLKELVVAAAGETSKELIKKQDHMKALKPKDFPSSKVDFVDDTAFIYFEEFAETGEESAFYYHLPSEEIYDSSTFGLFYDAFDKIQRHPGIKKVVIDLSNNGGGSVAALVAALGFLSPDGEVNVTYSHTLNQNYCSEWYHVDTNLDGKFDSGDGFGGRYDFYILTSGFSYSSANALPFFAQTAGFAKVIGEQPGGGDCAVMDFLQAYGHVAAMSGWIKLGRMENGSFVSDEHAVRVDYPFGEQADKLYYNYKGIAQWLKTKK